MSIDNAPPLDWRGRLVFFIPIYGFGVWLSFAALIGAYNSVLSPAQDPKTCQLERQNLLLHSSIQSVSKPSAPAVLRWRERFTAHLSRCAAHGISDGVSAQEALDRAIQSQHVFRAAVRSLAPPTLGKP